MKNLRFGVKIALTSSANSFKPAPKVATKVLIRVELYP